MLHIPAIHKFSSLQSVGKDKWGFHRLPEVKEAACNRNPELSNMTLVQFLTAFIHWTGGKKIRSCGGFWHISELDTLWKDCDDVASLPLSSAHEDYREEDMERIYVPAGWSMAVLKVAEQGAVIAKLVRISGNKVSEVIYDAYGGEIRVGE